MDLVLIIGLGVVALTLVWCMADAKKRDDERRRKKWDEEHDSW